MTRQTPLLFAAAILFVGRVAADGLEVVKIDSPANVGTAEPNLAAHRGAVYLSWLQELPQGGHALEWSRWDGSSWSKRRLIHSSQTMLANWADFPSLLVLDDGTLVAHWLEKSGDGTYDYDIWIRMSKDDGASWTETERPYRDKTKGEHGFVSMVNEGDGRFAVVWLDARRFAASPEREMSLMFTMFDGSAFQPETLLDGRVCDCCQTAAAATREGLFVAYRDRSEDEVRDISYMRQVGDEWTEPRTLHADGWEIPACPVNGPSVAVQGGSLAVAWFSLVDEEGRVRATRSEDDGRSFGDPVRLDGGQPLGRVDVEWLGDDTFLVSWLERIDGGQAEVRVQAIRGDESVGSPEVVARTSASRASGFPRLARTEEGALIAWTDAEAKRVRLAKIAP